MKQVTLNIPDNKYQFFIELVNNLGFDEPEEISIPDRHKTIVRNRILNSKSEELIPWEDAREKLRFKSKS